MESPVMKDLERIWSRKSDDELLEAAATLNDYTDEGRRIVLAELERRGFELPSREGDGDDATPDDLRAGEALPDDPLSCLRCGVKLQHLGTRHMESLGELGRMFEGTRVLEAYVCPTCGHVDLFTDLHAEHGVEDE